MSVDQSADYTTAAFRAYYHTDEVGEQWLMLASAEDATSIVTITAEDVPQLLAIFADFAQWRVSTIRRGPALTPRPRTCPVCGGAVRVGGWPDAQRVALVSCSDGWHML